MSALLSVEVCLAAVNNVISGASAAAQAERRLNDARGAEDRSLARGLYDGAVEELARAVARVLDDADVVRTLARVYRQICAANRKSPIRDQEGHPVVEVLAKLALLDGSVADGGGDSPAAAAKTRRLTDEALRLTGGEGIARLTRRETEIMSLIALGLDSRAIARRLCISGRTERNHVASILEKLGVHSRLEALVKCHRCGIVAVG
jgi:DNA-binding CsgD family transcriptional regulator